MPVRWRCAMSGTRAAEFAATWNYKKFPRNMCRGRCPLWRRCSGYPHCGATHAGTNSSRFDRCCAKAHVLLLHRAIRLRSFLYPKMVSGAFGRRHGAATRVLNCSLWRYGARVSTRPSQGRNPGSNPGIAAIFPVILHQSCTNSH